MRMTIHCPALYELAEDDERTRGAVVAAIKRWPDQVDQERAIQLLKHLEGSVNHFVSVSVPENPRDPLLRAHQMASRDPAHWLVDLLEHRGRGDSPADPSSVKRLEDLLMMGLDRPWETRRVLPPRGAGDKRWSREEFSSVVWRPIFRWTKTLRIYDRNIVTYWPMQDGARPRYPSNLQWILEEFAEWQPGGEVMIALVPNSDPHKRKVVRQWCCDQEDRLGIVIKTPETLDRYFHDRYFHTQQGWWRSHRGVDLCTYGYQQQQWMIESDAELTWQAYAPPGLECDLKRLRH